MGNIFTCGAMLFGDFLTFLYPKSSGEGGEGEGNGCSVTESEQKEENKGKKGLVGGWHPPKGGGGVISRNADCAIPSDKSKAEEEEEEPLLVLQLCKVLVTTILVFLVLQLS